MSVVCLSMPIICVASRHELLAELGTISRNKPMLEELEERGTRPLTDLVKVLTVCPVNT